MCVNLLYNQSKQRKFLLVSSQKKYWDYKGDPFECQENLTLKVDLFIIYKKWKTPAISKLNIND